MTKPENYLFALEDGLETRSSQQYAQDKLLALEAYLNMAQQAMKNKEWSAYNYIDLQAGPGKNLIDGKIHFGSPLIALTTNPPFTHYWFNEWDEKHCSALKQRVSQSSLASRIHVFQEDANVVVNKIVNSVKDMDIDARASGRWSTLNIAFLDPEGLEIHWQTIETLASVSRMDMIINFSTGGINRNLHQPEVIDRFFGSASWRDQVTATDQIHRRRQFIETYRNQLRAFGYHIEAEPDNYHDIPMRNSKNAEVYSLIFASKNKLGDRFWQQVREYITRVRHKSNPLL